MMSVSFSPIFIIIIYQFLVICFLETQLTSSVTNQLPVLVMEMLQGSLDDLLQNTPNIPWLRSVPSYTRCGQRPCVSAQHLVISLSSRQHIGDLLPSTYQDQIPELMCFILSMAVGLVLGASHDQLNQLMRITKHLSETLLYVPTACDALFHFSQPLDVISMILTTP